MIVDRSKFDAAFKSFNTLFNDAIANTQVVTERIASVVTSTGTEETYDWMGPPPKMKEWLGDRPMSGLRAYDWTIKNKDWANGIEVRANDIRDDKLGMVAPKIRRLAEMGARHEEELLINLLTGGFASVGYDGQFFFDTDHKDGDGPTQSNTTAAALDATSYAAAWASMLAVKDENSEPLQINTNDFLLIVGPSKRDAARQLLLADRNASGATNTNAGTAQLLVHPRITNGNWFLLAVGDSVKPLILQRREPLQFIAQDAPDSDNYFNRKAFRYGANWRGNVGYGLWQLAYGSSAA